MKIRKQNRNQKRGAALVEYGLIVAGVALVCAAAISIFGQKTGGIIGATARVLPGAQAADNALISVGQVVETKVGLDGSIGVNSDPGKLDGLEGTINDNLGLGDSELVDDPNDN